MIQQSALYVGSVVHRRLRPRRHDLRYRVFWMLLDIDELDLLDRGLRLFSRGRFNIVSFCDADYGNGTDEPLRTQVERHLAAAGIAPDGGAIRLLCMPRILGYGFNPLSVFYCYNQSDDLVALIYEVHNTFNERHSYLIAVDVASEGAIRQRCNKVFYVSPFLKMGMIYEFRVTRPEERVGVVIHGRDDQGPLISASLGGVRVALSDGALLRLLVSHPLLTLKVTAAIHWHALRLWWKGVALQPHPAPPARAVTVVQAEP